VTELADESQMQTLATALAQLIDEKLLAAAK